MRRLIGLLGVVCLLASCGGSSSNSSSSSSSSSSTTQSTTGQAQGVYSGSSTSPTGSSFESIVLPNDSYFAIYGTTTGNLFLISGMITGQGTSKNGAYTASVTDFYYTGLTSTGSLTATYVPGTSLNGSLVESGVTATFTGNSIPTSQFNYNMPASLSAITGTWSGNLLDGSSATVTIASNGTLSGSNLGCTFSGTLVADGAKNFFTLTLTFANTSACLLPGQTATGIGITYLLSNNTTRQLLFGGTAAGGTKGTLFLATR